jgi:hypothetical protein
MRSARGVKAKPPPARQSPAMDDVVMQRENEISRVVVDGKRVDDGDHCTLVVVHERAGGCWAFYPHGFGKFGVRLTKTDAVKVVQEILAQNPRPGPE